MIAVKVSINHPLHAVLTVLTCGLWGVVWFLVWLLQPTVTIEQAAPMPGWYPTPHGSRYWDGREWE